MQKKLGDQTIPNEIAMICFEFYFIERDRFEINDDYIFEYKPDNPTAEIYIDADDGYRIFGEKKVDREIINEYKWEIETSEHYVGRFGIIDDTNNSSSEITHGSSEWLWERKDVIIVGTKNEYWYGNYLGHYQDEELQGFVAEKGDIVTIHLDYVKNIVTFESQATKNKVERALKDEMKTARFIAEFVYNAATMKILQ